MDAYTGFAEVYDLFMDNVPYDDWTARLAQGLAGEGIEDGLVCELGCGTGQMTRRMALLGYDMIGIDASEEMLDVAQNAAAQQAPFPILYLLQDIRAFELYGTVRAVFSVCGTLNYITDPEDLLTVFRLVNNYLDPRGVFFFDVHMPAYYEAIGNSTIAETRDEAAFIWENDYDPDMQEDVYDMTFFIREDPADGAEENASADRAVYRRIEETHVQRGWTEEEVRRILEMSGLTLVSIEDADTGEAVSEETETLWVCAREQGK